MEGFKKAWGSHYVWGWMCDGWMWFLLLIDGLQSLSRVGEILSELSWV